MSSNYRKSNWYFYFSHFDRIPWPWHFFLVSGVEKTLFMGNNFMFCNHILFLWLVIRKINTIFFYQIVVYISSKSVVKLLNRLKWSDRIERRRRRGSSRSSTRTGNSIAEPPHDPAQSDIMLCLESSLWAENYHENTKSQ